MSSTSQRSTSQQLARQTNQKRSSTSANTGLVALPVDLWRLIRDCIGWSELLPLVRVCTSLSGLLKNPQFWTGLAELDLCGFRHGGPLVGLVKILRDNRVTFPKVRINFNTTDSDIKLLSGLGVQQLDLSHCQGEQRLNHHLAPQLITDTGLSHLTNLPLENLELADCGRIMDAGLAHLSAFSLQKLGLAGCRSVTDAGLAHLTAFPLKHLNFMNTYITDAGLAHLAALPLQHLNLAGTRITDAGLAHLTALPLERHLDLDDTGITDAGLAHLTAFSLQHLSLHRCWSITNAGLAHLAALPLQHLNLTCCRQITNSGLAHLSTLPLQHLDHTLCYCPAHTLAHWKWADQKH